MLGVSVTPLSITDRRGHRYLVAAVFGAEWGNITQITTANLAARYGSTALIFTLWPG
jgi:putative Ca2+/H+ antiporter (TMEM165/GDT1 family)